MSATAATLKLPDKGPRDPEVWLTLFGLATHADGAIDADGGVWVVDRVLKVKYAVDPAHIDTLTAIGWVDDTRGHDELHVTEAGIYWCRRFAKLNGGRV